MEGGKRIRTKLNIATWHQLFNCDDSVDNKLDENRLLISS